MSSGGISSCLVRSRGEQASSDAVINYLINCFVRAPVFGVENV